MTSTRIQDTTSPTGTGLLSLPRRGVNHTVPTEPGLSLYPALQGGNLFILPNQIKEMYVTKITIIPSSVILLVSSIIMCFTILVYFRRVLKIYLSLLFYAITELVLFSYIVVFYFLTTQDYLQDIPCGISKSIGLFTIVLPVLAILLITICRLVFVKYPLQYRSILRMKYQISFFVGIVIWGLTLSLPPALGACDAVYISKYRICQFKASPVCTCYMSVYVTFGIATPTGMVIAIYIWVYHILRKHRARSKSFTKRNNPKKIRSDRSMENDSSLKDSSIDNKSIYLPPRKENDIDKKAKKRQTYPTGRNFTIPEIKITEHTTDILIVNELALRIDNKSTDDNCISISTKTTITTSITNTDATFDVILRSEKPASPNLSPTSSASHLISDSAASLLSPKHLKDTEVRKETVQFTEIKQYLRNTVGRLSRSSRRESELLFERGKDIPWSLVLLTFIHILSSVPWIFVEFYSHVFFEASPDELAFLDIVNAMLAISVCISPLFYILFTRLIRDKVKYGLRVSTANVKRLYNRVIVNIDN